MFHFLYNKNAEDEVNFFSITVLFSASTSTFTSTFQKTIAALTIAKLNNCIEVVAMGAQSVCPIEE